MTEDLRNVPTARLRELAHQAFDPLWEAMPWYRQRKFRGVCYAWLAERLSLREPKAHISVMQPHELRDAIRVCSYATPHEIETWAKARAKAKRNAR